MAHSFNGRTFDSQSNDKGSIPLWVTKMDIQPRIRFVKVGDFKGSKTVVVDGQETVTDCRISVNGDRVFEIHSINIVGEGGFVNITFLDGCVFRLHSTEVELTTPQPYQAVPQKCCGN